MSEYINKTGARLAALRKENKLTQKAVAEKLGINEKSYTVWEVGRRKKSHKIGETTRPEKEAVDISNAHLCALADLYGVSVDYILGRTDYKTINGADVARITGLSDHAISVLQWYGGADNLMQYHIARDVSRLVSDWEKNGANSLVSAIKNYAQCEPGRRANVAPDSGGLDALPVEMDMNAALLFGIAAAAERFKADFQKELNAARAACTD